MFFVDGGWRVKCVMRLEILLSVFLSLTAGCSKHVQQPATEDQSTPNAPSSSEAIRPEESGASFGKAGAGDLRAAAVAGNAPAQRELAERMLFGKGLPADPEGALVWVERAARGGDATATLWMGRKHLSEPQDRIAAAAWFLLAANGQNPAVRQDAAGELEALALSAAELDLARTLESKLKAEISSPSK